MRSRNYTATAKSLEQLNAEIAQRNAERNLVEIYIGHAARPESIDDTDRSIAQRETSKEDYSVITDLAYIANVMKWRKLEGVAYRQAKRAIVNIATYYNQPIASINNAATIATLLEIETENELS